MFQSRAVVVVVILHLLLLLLFVVNGINLCNSPTYKIVGTGTATQHLPESYMNSFPRWMVRKDPREGVQIEKQAVHGSRSSNVVRSLLPTRDHPWFLRPYLQVLIRGGIPSYLMVASVVTTTTTTTPTTTKLPQNVVVVSSMMMTAQQWISFAWAADPNFRLWLFGGNADGTDDLLATLGASCIPKALDLLATLLQLPTAQELATGFHIVSLPLDEDDDDENSSSSSLPKTVLVSNPEYAILTCLVTAEKDAREILTLDPLLAEMTLSSILQIPLLQPEITTTADTVEL